MATRTFEVDSSTPRPITRLSERLTIQEVANEISMKTIGKPRSNPFELKDIVSGQPLVVGDEIKDLTVNFNCLEWRNFQFRQHWRKGVGLFINKNMNIQASTGITVGSSISGMSYNQTARSAIEKNNGKQILFEILPHPQFEEDNGENDTNFVDIVFITHHGNFYTRIYVEFEVLLYKLKFRDSLWWQFIFTRDFSGNYGTDWETMKVRLLCGKLNGTMVVPDVDYAPNLSSTTNQLALREIRRIEPIDPNKPVILYLETPTRNNGTDSMSVDSASLWEEEMSRYVGHTTNKNTTPTIRKLSNLEWHRFFDVIYGWK